MRWNILQQLSSASPLPWPVHCPRARAAGLNFIARIDPSILVIVCRTPFSKPARRVFACQCYLKPAMRPANSPFTLSLRALDAEPVGITRLTSTGRLRRNRYIITVLIGYFVDAQHVERGGCNAAVNLTSADASELLASQ